MKTIHKYNLGRGETGRKTISTPKGAVLMSVQNQDEQPTAWFLVDLDKTGLETHVFDLCVTGQEFHYNYAPQQIHTMQFAGGKYVLHSLYLGVT